MAAPIRLFQLGQRGVDVVNKPQDLDESELVHPAQNVEISTSGGGGALDQRCGMTRIGNSALAGSVAMVLDVPIALQVDGTPTLVAGLYTGSTHNWRTSTDGTTWTNLDTPSKPLSNIASVAYFKNFPKCVTVGRYVYFVDASMQIHQWDGTTDNTLATIPTTAHLPSPYSTMVVNIVTTSGAAGAYTYVCVPKIGGSLVGMPTASKTIANGPTTLDATHYNSVSYQASTGNQGRNITTYDVYRTSGGASQGKIGSRTFATGTALDDKALAGDGVSPPTTVSAAPVITVLDMTTDGTVIYLCVLDSTTDPAEIGRLLSFNPATQTFTELANLAGVITIANTDLDGFALGNGAPSATTIYNGVYTYGTYIGTTNGNTSFVKSLTSPNPTGGVTETHATSASFGICALCVFKGDLYVGTVSLVGGTSATVLKRTLSAGIGSWSTAKTGPATIAQNAYTSLWVFNNKLYAGWTSGDGSSVAKIQSTSDGTTWSDETASLASTDVVCQAVTFGGNLYVALGKTGASYNTTASILKSTTAGAWSAVDTPTDKYAGCLGVVYI